MIRVIVILYLAGLFFLYATYINHEPYPDVAYYFWEKTTSAGCLVWLTLFLNCRKDRSYTFLAFFVSCVRFIWQGVAMFVYYKWGKGIEPGDDWRVAACFCSMLLAAAILLFLRNTILTTFLDKQLKRLGL